MASLFIGCLIGRLTTLHHIYSVHTSFTTLSYSPTQAPPLPSTHIHIHTLFSHTHTHTHTLTQWFFANYLYAKALDLTSVAAVNTLSSTSGVFVMALAALPCLSVTAGDKLTLSRCLVTLIR